MVQDKNSGDVFQIHLDTLLAFIHLKLLSESQIRRISEVSSDIFFHLTELRSMDKLSGKVTLPLSLLASPFQWGKSYREFAQMSINS